MIQGGKARKLIILDQVGKGRFCVDDAYEAEQRIQAMTSWNDLVDEKTSLVGGICQNYEVLVKEKRKRPNEQMPHIVPIFSSLNGYSCSILFNSSFTSK